MLGQKMGNQIIKMGTEKCETTMGPLQQHTTPKAAKPS